ncbi:hypothetical protein JW935_21540 [candidate division KSB1 bacterium]|nr:hypothetical protein [candidate division KSB1 bacterium]
MKTLIVIFFSCLLLTTTSFAQEPLFKKLDFIIGEWSGTGSDFGNSKSQINSEFLPVMDGKYIRVSNNSQFEPTDKNPEGENHVDWGMISFDESRGMYIYRQFNNEGYVNQYVLTDSLTNDSTLVFDTEIIENFVAGGKARLTIKKI